MLKSSPQRRLTSVFDLGNPGRRLDSDLKFPSTSPVYCHQNSSTPSFKKQDHKTLLAVTNVAVELVSILTNSPRVGARGFRKFIGEIKKERRTDLLYHGFRVGQIPFSYQIDSIS